MRALPRSGQSVWPALLGVSAAVIALSVLPTPRTSPGHYFLASLRMAKAQPMSVNIPSFSGANSGHQLQDLVMGMVTDKPTISGDEAEKPAPDLKAAATLAGFGPKLPAARRDKVTLTVLGGRTIQARVQTHLVQTMLNEAGVKRDVPSSIEGQVLAITASRAVRAEYGNCPAPVPATLQGQIQGAPPPSTDNGNCVILTQQPAVSANVPNGLDPQQLTDIALQLAGMSPNQSHAFQQMFEWRDALSISLPRGMRSFDTTRVNGAPAMLVGTAARRGPTWELIWANAGTVYALAGYGSSGEAAALAASIK